MAGTNWFIDLISHPYAKGLLTGLFFCAVLLVRHMLQKRELKGELHNLRKHLHTKLEIDAEENVRRKDLLERLKKEAENLRGTVQILQQKPGRKELRQYYIYQKALDKMLEKAPGFAPAWQITLREAEEEFNRAEQGLVPFLHRLVPLSPAAQIEEFEKMSRNAARQTDEDPVSSQ